MHLELLMKKLILLTERELECLLYAANGATERETALSLGISPHTVHIHLGNSKEKLRAKNKLHTVVLALRYDLIAWEDLEDLD